eukprot:scaffold133893_cov124-Phaeocystis_antarctica.AAC.1
MRISAMGSDYNAKLDQQYGMLNTFVDHVQASKENDLPSYINHHGWQASRAHGVNQERGVTNIVLGMKDKQFESAVYGKQRVYKMGQLHANAYQLAPSAWTAAAACHTIEMDYQEVAPANSLMELDANFDLKVTEEEFRAKCPSATAIFTALDSEGATFAEDTQVCLSLGCTKSSGSWGHASDADKNRICMVCDAQRKPAPVKNNLEVSIGLMEEIRVFASDASYPWSHRKIVAITQELPKSADALHALYKPESTLVRLGCDGTPQPTLVAKLTDQSPMNEATFEALFAGLERYKRKALFAAYSTKECPADWRGNYIQGDETSLAPGLSYDIGQKDSVYNFNGAG